MLQIKKLKDLELAAKNNKLDKNKIFEIYKQIPFNLSALVNAKNNYQTLDESDAEPLFIKNIYYPS